MTQSKHDSQQSHARDYASKTRITTTTTSYLITSDRRAGDSQRQHRATPSISPSTAAATAHAHGATAGRAYGGTGHPWIKIRRRTVKAYDGAATRGEAMMPMSDGYSFVQKPEAPVPLCFT